MTELGIVIGLATLLFAFLTFMQGRGTERRALEARNVVWSREQIDGDWHFQHSGSTSVSEVMIVLTVDGKSEITRADTLAPNTPLLAKNAEHSDTKAVADEQDAEYDAEVEEFNSPSTRRVGDGPFSIDIPIMKVPPLPRMAWKVECSAIITWRYPSGVPDIHEAKWVEVY